MSVITSSITRLACLNVYIFYFIYSYLYDTSSELPCLSNRRLVSFFPMISQKGMEVTLPEHFCLCRPDRLYFHEY